MRWLCRCKVPIPMVWPRWGPTSNSAVSWLPQPGILSIGLELSDAIKIGLITDTAPHICSTLPPRFVQYCDEKLMEEQTVFQCQLNGGCQIYHSKDLNPTLLSHIIKHTKLLKLYIKK